MESYNRTILELKQFCYSGYGDFARSYNRTILELKQGISNFLKGYQYPYNRTILELKLIKFVFWIIQFIQLIIAPFWNWNTETQPS